MVSPDFVAEFTNVLASNGCEGLFGIDTLVDNDWTELKIGNASIVVPSNGKDKEETYIPVAFAFDDQKPGFKIHGKCRVNHAHTSKPPPPKKGLVVKFGMGHNAVLGLSNKQGRLK